MKCRMKNNPHEIVSIESLSLVLSDKKEVDLWSELASLMINATNINYDNSNNHITSNMEHFFGQLKKHYNKKGFEQEVFRHWVKMEWELSNTGWLKRVEIGFFFKKPAYRLCFPFCFSWNVLKVCQFFSKFTSLTSFHNKITEFRKVRNALSHRRGERGEDSARLKKEACLASESARGGPDLQLRLTPPHPLLILEGTGEWANPDWITESTH